MEAKTYSELSEKERKSFLSIFDPAGSILALVNAIKKKESVNINVAFNDVGTAVDYQVFDPYHLYTDVYTDATGWSEWQCGLL